MPWQAAGEINNHISRIVIDKLSQVNRGERIMNILGRRKVVDGLINKLKSDMDSLIPNIPDHWDDVELAWLVATRAEWLTSTRTDLGLRRKSFKLWISSKHP
jgi:hypothetical protein